MSACEAFWEVLHPSTALLCGMAVHELVALVLDIYGIAEFAAADATTYQLGRGGGEGMRAVVKESCGELVRFK